VIDWTASGKVAKVDLDNMQVLDTTRYDFMPHGSAVSPDGQYIYFTATAGNFLYKQNIQTGDMDFVKLNPSDPPGIQPSSVYNPHEIFFLPDGSKYYVTCQNEHTVRVFDAADNYLTTIPISGSTLELAYAPSRNLLFVTSWDANQFPNTVGAVGVINTVTNSLQSYVNVGTQPHGIAVDESHGVVYVANRNIDVTGPLPHHTSVCGGRNGNVVFIDLNSLQLTGKRIEVSVDPYSIGVRE
jgi:DNA-binding beta-propeller fold protein YncE